LSGVKHSSTLARPPRRRIAGVSFAGQVVQDDEQPVTAGAGGPDRLERGQGVIGTLALGGHAPQLVIADAVAAMEVTGALGAAVGGAQPGRTLAFRQRAAMTGPDR